MGKIICLCTASRFRVSFGRPRIYLRLRPSPVSSVAYIFSGLGLLRWLCLLHYYALPRLTFRLSLLSQVQARSVYSRRGPSCTLSKQRSNGCFGHGSIPHRTGQLPEHRLYFSEQYLRKVSCTVTLRWLFWERRIRVWGIPN